MVRVVAAVVMDAGQVMIARRQARLRMGGLWEFPGGKVEPGESDEIALVRELQEELNLVVAVHEFLGESIHDDGRGPLTLVAYRCTIESGQMTLNDHDAVRFVPPDEFGEYEFAPADVPLLAAISERASCT
jgi:8-oxo-dGTP diphosphatase